jgi:hypothetical protein
LLTNLIETELFYEEKLRQELEAAKKELEDARNLENIRRIGELPLSLVAFCAEYEDSIIEDIVRNFLHQLDWARKRLLVKKEEEEERAKMIRKKNESDD